MARAAHLPRGRLGIILLIFVAASSFAAFATVVGQSAHLSAPSQAMPGETITVHGSGFAANQSGRLTYDGAVIAPFQASQGGEFNVGLSIPASAAGTGLISAKTSSDQLLATTTLEITVEGVSPGSASPPSAAPPTSAPSYGATLSSGSTSSASAAAGSAAGAVPTFTHVYVIVFENHEDTSIVGSADAPFINSLISRYGVSTTFYAETHPSQPNYFVLASGSKQGVADDGPYELTGTNLFHQLTLVGRQWRTYAQGYPGNCFTGSQSPAVADGPGLAGIYRRAHNPAISFTDVNNYRNECQRIRPLSDFDPSAADFELIVPNNVNSMHDGTVRNGDAFLQALLPKITGSAAFTNSVVFVTFDEGVTNAGGGGRVATIAIPSSGAAVWDPAKSYGHDSILRTVEQGWGLPLLGTASTASPILFADSPQTTPAPTDTASPSPTPAATPTPQPTEAPTESPTAGPSLAPPPAATPTPGSAASWPPAATASRMNLLTPCSDVADCYVYMVRGAGQNGATVNDDLSSIARFFGVTETGIRALNPGLTTPLIPGQPLRIPPPTR